MNFIKPTALSLILSAALVSGANATTSYGFDLWGGGIGKKGTMKVVNTGDAMITGITLGISDKKHKFKRNGSKSKEITLSESLFDGYGASSFKVKTIEKNGKKKAFSKALFNNGKRKNGYISVDFLVEGEEVTMNASLRDIRKKYFKKEKYRGVMQLLAGDHVMGFLDEPERPVQPGNGPGEPGGCGNYCGGGGETPAVVPIPAALPLMLTGLFGMGLIARRRKA